MKIKYSMFLISLFLLLGCFEKNILIGYWELENENSLNPIREISFSKDEMLNTLGVKPVVKYEVSSKNIKVYLTEDKPLVFLIKNDDQICTLSKLALLLPAGDNCYKRVQR